MPTTPPANTQVNSDTGVAETGLLADASGLIGFPFGVAEFVCEELNDGNS